MKVKPKKSLGQNFLKNYEVIKKIISCGALNEDENIIEVGPGTGNLTEKLILYKPKNFFLVEKDNKLCDLLKEKFNNSITIINEDILNFELNSLNCNNLIVFGNLPYNISTQILINWILYNYNFFKIKRLVLMFQKEVADRILGKVNEKNYGRLSIIANWKFKIKKEFDIDATAFYPKPKVTSTLLSMVPRDNFFEIKNPKNLEKITSIFFNQKRKMIKKPLNKIFNNSSSIIKKLNIDINLRPQNLKPEIYFELAKILDDSNN
tara:strand:+ start:386 stop:1177 length:792 start_codon:yes stop_codon:yes gene_type:complete